MNTSRGRSRWLTGQAVLPNPLRGDAGDLPVTVVAIACCYQLARGPSERFSPEGFGAWRSLALDGIRRVLPLMLILGTLSATNAWDVPTYAALAVVVLAGWELTLGTLQPKHFFAVWLAGTLYGAIDEVTQIPFGRVSDPSDWMADCLGVVIGLVTYLAVRRLWRGAPKPLTR